MAGKPTYEELAQEIEERTVTEQTLKDSQRLLQTVIDTIEGEVFVKDTNGKYLFVNKAFGKDFGVNPKAVIGKDGAAVLLDINPSTLRGRMRKQGIRRPPYKT